MTATGHRSATETSVKSTEQLTAQPAQEDREAPSWRRGDTWTPEMAKLEFLKNVSLLAGLSEAEFKALAADVVTRRFKEGEVLFYQGDAGEVLYFIAFGQVRIFVQSESGQEVSVNVCGSGDFFGELAVIDERPRSATAVATQHTLVFVLSRERFLEHMRRSPRLALNFLEAMSTRVRYSTRTVGSLSLLDIPGRVARKLLDLAQTYGEPEGDGVRIGLALTQSDLASLVGATRESINKVLGSFRRQGLIRIEQGHFVILNRAGLEELLKAGE